MGRTLTAVWNHPDGDMANPTGRGNGFGEEPRLAGDPAGVHDTKRGGWTADLIASAQPLPARCPAVADEQTTIVVQRYLAASVAMPISVVNAMTMTPARAAAIFAGRKPGRHGDQGKEALPWWFFGVLGGPASVSLLAPARGPDSGCPCRARGQHPAACKRPCWNGGSTSSSTAG
jgi:hypothetical protein